MAITANLLSTAATQGEIIPNWMVVVMGMGTVFLGLICIIILCKIMGAFFSGSSRPEEKKTEATTSPAVQNEVIENRQEIIAAITAACAEDMGKDVSALRVVSFKKL